MSRRIAFLISVLFLASVATARDVIFQSDPPGATVVVQKGHPRLVGTRITTPGSLTLRSHREAYVFEFSLPGYETERISHMYQYERDATTLRVSLKQLVLERTFQIATEPAGVEVMAGTRVLGVTPLQVNLRFERRTADYPWPEYELVFRKADYQTERRTFTHASPDKPDPLQLTRIAMQRTFMIKVTTESGEALAASVEVGGQIAGPAPQSLTLPFSRQDAYSEWNRHVVRAFIENEFLPRAVTLSVDSPEQHTLALSPVTEIPVKRFFPAVEITARGPRQAVDVSSRKGKLDIRDIHSPAVDLRPVTNFTREQLILQSVNSFCLTPDGRQIIYSVTSLNEEGQPYANLFIKSSSDQSFAFQQLTRGSRFLDSRPIMPREEDSTLVVFQSNRGPVDSWDISSFHLRDGRVVGGIQQLTRDSRLNYHPFIMSEALPVYFSSSETFPNAIPFISHTRVDGSSFTNLGESGAMINASDDGTIYFVRPADDTGNLQIYSVNADGFNFSSVINDVQFARANMHSPNASPDGNRLLFVSDYSGDTRTGGDNNIYIFDKRNGRIQQVTDNESDDVHPLWSPTEPSVVYFLSNRGGVYNIWRIRMVSFE
jgi:hypothetical protein